MSKVDIGDWTVQVINDDDGHLNVYITNSKSSKLYDVDIGIYAIGEPYPDDELHYRITTKEIEDEYCV